MFEIRADIYLFSRSIKNTRISEIDFIRGLCILLMIVDHFFLIFGTTNVSLFGEPSALSPMFALTRFSLEWWYLPFRINMRVFIICVFFFISGVSSAFSRNNIRRGLWIFIVSLCINAFMFGAEVYVGMEGMVTYFGAINCFGVTILIYALYELLMNKLKVRDPYKLRITLIIGLIISLIGFTNELTYELGATIARENLDFIIFIKYVFGFERVSSVGDFLPLFPYLGFFFFGASFAQILYKNKESLFAPLYKYIPAKPNKNDSSKQSSYYLSWSVYCIYTFFNSIAFIIKKSGRYSLIVYLVHQFVLLLILIIVMYSLGYSIQL